MAVAYDAARVTRDVDAMFKPHGIVHEEAWPSCWAACGRRARTSRPPRCWPATPPPSTTRPPWASLLHSLRHEGAHEQAAALAGRAAAHAPLDNPYRVASLLASLPTARTHEQAALTSRLPTAGMFRLFLEQNGSGDQFRFGREADGTPAALWGWEDLDLWLVPRDGLSAPKPKS
jgi:hypothetical protein